MFELNNLDSLKISIASPDRIREWSRGEVLKPETINYRTQKPEKDGLFCERIFGPKKDWQCACGKYKLIRYKGTVCDKCGVEVTRSIVRRERMGHIELAAPVTHIWYFKGVPSRIGAMLDMTVKSLEQVIYFVSFVVINKGKTALEVGQVLSDRELHEAQEKYGVNGFKAGMGAEAILEMLRNVDIDKEILANEEIVKKGKGVKRDKAIKKLGILKAFKESGNRPEWMVMTVLPVTPPELRPMVQIDGGRFATTDVNDLYRRVINRNNRLKKLISLNAPDVIVRNEKRMLQEAVDALFDNGRRGRAVQGAKQRDLKSLAAGLRGKQGRFRNNLLGKRVDYSGRTVIVVGPELKHYQVGIPKEMALELFKPFVMNKLVEYEFAHHSRSAKRLIEKEKPVVWDVLAEVIKDHPVLLNRQPTLHRLSIQAFEPVLIDGRAIRLHPLVCPAFNADFDGDQMTVHVPLSQEAQAEARILMLASNNILKPSDGRSIVTPTQDIVLGCYYLTILKDGAMGEGSVYRNEAEAEHAYANHQLDLHARIKVRRSSEELDYNPNEEVGTEIVETTLGRIIFNRCFPQDIGILDRSKDENKYLYEIDKVVIRKDLNDIIVKTFKNHGATVTSETIDNIKNAGFKYSTLGSISISVFDAVIPEERATLIADAEKRVKVVEDAYANGELTLDEKLDKNIAIWQETTEAVQKKVVEHLSAENPIKMMAESGARGSNKQIMQLSGMRGIIANVSGQKEDVPTKSCYRLGLKPLEYFLSSRGGRKGLADTALKTADAGYLTRRLADVSQDVIINEEDCFAGLGEKPKGIVMRTIETDGYVEKLEDRIVGRYTTHAVLDPKTKKPIVGENSMISEEAAKEIVSSGIKEVEIRTALTCKCRQGICAKCYGRDMSGYGTVQIGEAVGIIAAQSIGEPGTQLTMRTKHAGGIATSNITEGLPRVEEILEAREPKGVAIVSEVGGSVLSVRKVEKKQEVSIKSSDGRTVTYLIPTTKEVIVKKDSAVLPGSPLTVGVLNPHDILRTQGVKAVQDYLMHEVIKVYKTQDITLNNKHLEIIIRQMLKKVKIEDAGDTTLQAGDNVDINIFEEECERVMQEGGRPARAGRILLSITKAALKTDSFLSAASFQETSGVLTEAAIKGKTDHLYGLKENVIVGKLIPAGTGLARYRNIAYKTIGTVG
ncbi:MAG: DNA-directed RNA polymerase subunit beta' [Christensenellaceae bacterium]|jgi:DNA-directed RNA polymerase subunit beta'|nr:DNA-directed RNA polymerase subunit beta' [Christensenellaceae bacterium]